ncbi:MAG: hypothetical protein WBN88_00965, partial [Anderseniella sp.]
LRSETRFSASSLSLLSCINCKKSSFSLLSTVIIIMYEMKNAKPISVMPAITNFTIRLGFSNHTAKNIPIKIKLIPKIIGHLEIRSEN